MKTSTGKYVRACRCGCCDNPLYLTPSDAKACANCGAYFKPPSSHGRKNSCHDCASAGAAWNSYMSRI